MAKQTLMWTTLPNGGNAATAGTLRVSVLLSPRLEAPVAKSTLSAFPEMANWPAKAQNLKFTVHFKGATGTVSVSATISSTLQADLWAKLFPPTTFVRSHVPESLADRFIVSYPYGNMAKSLKNIYSLVAATSPAGYPPSDGLRGLLSPLTRANFRGAQSGDQKAAMRALLQSLKKPIRVLEACRLQRPTSSATCNCFSFSTRRK